VYIVDYQLDVLLLYLFLLMICFNCKKGNSKYFLFPMPLLGSVHSVDFVSGNLAYHSIGAIFLNLSVFALLYTVFHRQMDMVALSYYQYSQQRTSDAVVFK